MKIYKLASFLYKTWIRDIFLLKKDLEFVNEMNQEFRACLKK